MSISNISCSMPERADFKSESACCRVTAIALGIILLAGATLLLSGALGSQHDIPNWAGYAGLALGVSIIALGCFVHSRGKEEPNRPKMNISQDQAPKDQKIEKRTSDQSKRTDIFQGVKVLEFLEKGDIDQALREASRISDVVRFEQVMYRIAEQLCLKGQFTKAVAAIKKIQVDNDTKEKFLLSLAKDFIQKGKLDEALALLNDVVENIAIKDGVMVDIANAYLDLNDLKKALDVALGIVQNKDKKNAMLSKIAEKLLAKNNFDIVLDVIRAIDDDNLAVRVAWKLIDDGRFDQAWEIAKNVSFGNNEREDLILQVARSYFSFDIIDKALDALKQVNNHSKKKEKLVFEFSNYYLGKKDLENALKIAKAVDHDVFKNDEIENIKSRDGILFEIAEGYLTHKDLKKSFEVIKLVKYDRQNREIFLMRLASEHFTNNDENGLKEILKDLISNHLQSSAYNKRLHLVVSVDRNIARRNFCDKLIDEHYYQPVCNFLKDKKVAEALTFIQENLVQNLDGFVKA